VRLLVRLCFARDVLPDRFPGLPIESHDDEAVDAALR